MSTDFWTSSGRYGLVHKTAAPRADPEALVVLVLGIFGNCRRTWGRMPQWVLEAGKLPDWEQMEAARNEVLEYFPDHDAVSGQVRSLPVRRMTNLTRRVWRSRKLTVQTGG
jgi:hypothetical protein